jgi:DNA-binding PadR family transcriptional regulator
LVRKLEVDEDAGEQLSAKERQQFELTQKGEQALQVWLQRAPSTPKPMRDELLVRLLLLGKGSNDQAIARIDAQQRLYTRYLAKLRSRERKLNKETGDEMLSAVLGLDAARLHAEAHIKWLENCRLRFQELSASSTDDGSQEPSE